MRSGTAFLVLIAACAVLVLAGCEARQEGADAETATDGPEVVYASNTGEEGASGGCVDATEGCVASCDKASAEEGCMSPISASAAEGGAEMTTAENTGGGCPYAEKAAAEKASAEKTCGGCPRAAKMKESAAEADAMVDLVYGMATTDDSEFSSQHGEATYCFCSGDCRDSFASEPGKYIQ